MTTTTSERIQAIQDELASRVDTTVRKLIDDGKLKPLAIHTNYNTRRALATTHDETCKVLSRLLKELSIRQGIEEGLY